MQYCHFVSLNLIFQKGFQRSNDQYYACSKNWMAELVKSHRQGLIAKAFAKSAVQESSRIASLVTWRD